MWKVEAPEVKVEEIATRSANRVRDKQLAADIRLALPALASNHVELRRAVQDEDVHHARPADYLVQSLTDDQLRSLYDQQLAHQRGAAREIYDQILAGARHNLCSYCQHSQATTLDHFLPKSWIPGLAIEPWNLVPSCQQCNKHLSTFRATCLEDTLFHPYEESVSGRWLYARLTEGDPATLSFEARAPASVNGPGRERIPAQFSTLGLDLMFSAISSRDIAEARASISRSSEAAAKMGAASSLPADAVRDILQEAARAAFAVDANSRRGAAYEALAESEWFCTQGAYG